MTAILSLGHVAGLPLEEMAPAILAGASLLVATLFRAVGARFGRAGRIAGQSQKEPPA
jgi:hypothetical protein